MATKRTVEMFLSVKKCFFYRRVLRGGVMGVLEGWCGVAMSGDHLLCEVIEVGVGSGEAALLALAASLRWRTAEESE